MEATAKDSSTVIEFLPTLLHLAAVKKAKLLLKDFDFEILKEEHENIQEGNLILWSSIFDGSKLKDLDLELLKCKSAKSKCEIKLLKNESQSVKRKRRLKDQDEALKNRETLENGEETLKLLEEALINQVEALENREKAKKYRKLLKNRKEALKNREKELEKRRRILCKEILKNCEANPLTKRYRAQQNLLMIPPLLRNRVLEAVKGLTCCEKQWKVDHSPILELEDGECIFCIKSDGRIDGIETARNLVLNSSIEVRKRFLLACTYCFEENIEALWAEIGLSGQIENFKTASNSIVQFWINRMSRGCQGPWIRDLCTYLHFHPHYTIQRYSSFFPLLSPQQRRKFFSTLQFTSSDDLLLCLRAMTEEEQGEIILLCPEKVLYCYLYWPLRGLLLEVVKNCWKYIDDFCLHNLLWSIFFFWENEEFDSEIFEDIWNNIPDYLRNELHPEIRANADIILDEIKRERQALFEELRNSFQTKLNGNKTEV